MMDGPSGPHGWVATVHETIDIIPAGDWDLCAGPDDPLCAHAHLLALEQSGIAAPLNGFEPSHVVLRDGAGAVVAVAPAYLKAHSQGELGVDLGLGMAHQRAVGSYYPKLQVEVPLTPFAGKRLLVRPGLDRAAAVAALVAALKEVVVARGASSLQIMHMDKDDDCACLAGEGFTVTQTNTYLWRAGPDRSFHDMLARMKTNGRSEIRRQRRRLAPLGLSFRHYRGQDIAPDMVAPFFERYRDNFARHGTPIWLNEDYFRRVLETMPDRVELSVSRDSAGWVGAVLSIVAAQRGYTLYWGQSAGIGFLHFEQVFYRGIERAFVIGLETLDFGPTGAHKAERGLGIEPVHHALWFRNPAFAEIAAQACQHKMRAAAAERVTETARLPFMRPA